MLGVALFFRVSLCPYCNAQPRAFQRAADSLEGAGVKIAALSVDDEPTIAELIAKHGRPVGAQDSVVYLTCSRT
jgi:peroxiredoxin